MDDDDDDDDDWADVDGIVVVDVVVSNDVLPSSMWSDSLSRCWVRPVLLVVMVLPLGMASGRKTTLANVLFTTMSFSTHPRASKSCRKS